MATISAELDISRLVTKLKRLPDEVDTLMHDELRRNARLLVSSSGNVPGLVQVTPPNNGQSRGTRARKQGEATLTADIWRVYGTPGNLFALIKGQIDDNSARAFWLYVKKRDWEKVAEITLAAVGLRLQEFDDGAAHRSARARTTGRVSKKQRKVIYVADPKWIESYIKEKKANVGLLAAAPLAAANSKLGNIRGVPSWIARHRPHWGAVEEGGSSTTRFIEIRIVAPYIATGMVARFHYVLGYRVAAMKREAPFRIRAELKKQQLLQ